MTESRTPTIPKVKWSARFDLIIYATYHQLREPGNSLLIYDLFIVVLNVFLGTLQVQTEQMGRFQCLAPFNKTGCWEPQTKKVTLSEKPSDLLPPCININRLCFGGRFFKLAFCWSKEIHEFYWILNHGWWTRSAMPMIQTCIWIYPPPKLT